MKRGTLLTLFLFMVICVTAQPECPNSDSLFNPHSEIVRTKYFHTPVYKLVFIKNYALLIRMPTPEQTFTAYHPIEKESPANRAYYSLTAPYPFDAKKLNLPKYQLPKTTAADIILNVTDILLQWAFPEWKDVDL